MFVKKGKSVGFGNGIHSLSENIVINHNRTKSGLHLNNHTSLSENLLDLIQSRLILH